MFGSIEQRFHQEAWNGLEDDQTDYHDPNRDQDTHADCVGNTFFMSGTVIVCDDRDHSIVQELVETGKLTPNEAKAHPRKNIITRALGVDEAVDIDFCEDRMEPEDVLLLCTDGLTNYLETDEIFQITQTSGYYESAQQMVDLANQHGGGDNITVVAITY